MRSASYTGPRAVTPYPPGYKRRRMCSCCGRRSTHMGTVEGITLMSGCELSVWRWKRDPAAWYRAAAKADSERRWEQRKKRAAKTLAIAKGQTP